MKILLGLFVLFYHTNIYHVLSQQMYSGSCQQFGTPQVTFLFQSLYMGDWFIHGVYDYDDIRGRDCLTSRYNKTENIKLATISEGSKDLKTDEFDEIESLMVFHKPGRGHYEYRIPAENVSDWPIDILATDYFTYSIEWSCTPDGSNSGCYIWIMSRFRQVDNTFWAKVDPILQQHNICKDNIRIVEQDAQLCSHKTLNLCD